MFYFPGLSFCSFLKCHLLYKVFYEMLTAFSLNSNYIILTTLIIFLYFVFW